MKRNDQLKDNSTNSEEKSQNLKSRQTGKKKIKTSPKHYRLWFKHKAKKNKRRR